MKKYLVYEFEFVQDGDHWAVLPFDFEGATQSFNEEDAYVMAADFLNIKAWGLRSRGEELPVPTRGNKPCNGGYVGMVVAPVQYFEDECMTMAQAAEYLGVTNARIGQLVRTERIETQRSESHPLIVKASLDAYKASPRKAGRPRKS